MNKRIQEVIDKLENDGFVKMGVDEIGGNSGVYNVNNKCIHYRKLEPQKKYKEYIAFIQKLCLSFNDESLGKDTFIMIDVRVNI